jgi:subfamily B ATP-binding cassette protein MsbA
MFHLSENLKWFLSKFKPYKFILTLALLGAILEGLAYSGLSFALKNLIDKVLVEKNLQLLFFTVGFILGLGVLKQVGFLLSELLYKRAVVDISAKIRAQMFKKLVNTDAVVFYSKPSGEWVGRITNDVKTFKELSEGFGVKVLKEFFTSLMLIGVLLYFDWQLFLLFVLITPLLVKLFGYFGQKRKKYSKIYQERFADFINFATDLVENFENIKFLNLSFLTRLALKKIRELKRAEFKNILYTAGYLVSVELVGYLFVAAIILYGGYRVVQGDLTAGTFISFIGTLFLLYNSLQALQRAALGFRALEPVIVRIREVLNLPAEGGGNLLFEKLKNRVETRNLRLRLGEAEILKGIDLKVSKGEKILIKGPSGGGKSTLLKVLSSLFRNYEGFVFYDERELKELNLKTFRPKVFYLSQKTALFNDTIENNLRLIKPSATEEELIRALKLARAEFVFELPDGLKTLVGGGGVQLSGGQRQRIALARLFLTNPQVIFLDEATSALDPETERDVLQNILNTFGDKTLFFVSHREGYENLFDKTLRVEGGKLAADGGG